MRHTFFDLALVLASAGLAATGGRAQPPSRTPTPLREWRISADPVVRIGQEGRPDAESPRVAGLARFPSGEIVVANAATLELRLFTSAGEFVRALSRKGSGPGELEGLGWLACSGDTLFAFDGTPGPGQLHVFTESGGFRSRGRVRARNTGGPLGVLDRLRDGRLLVRSGVFRAPAPFTGLMRDTVRLGLLPSGENRDVEWLGTSNGQTSFAFRPPDDPKVVLLKKFPYGAQLVYAASGDQVWIGDSGTNAITVYGALGTGTARVRSPVPRRQFDPEAIERVKARELAAASDDRTRAHLEAMHDSRWRLRTAPFFLRFLAGIDGEMWIERYREDPSAPSGFFVLDRRGVPIARAAGPAGVRFVEIGRDYALGVRAKDDGAETVVVHRLER